MITCSVTKWSTLHKYHMYIVHNNKPQWPRWPQNLFFSLIWQERLTCDHYVVFAISHWPCDHTSSFSLIFVPINPAQAKVHLGLYAKFNRVSGCLKLPDCFYLTHNIVQGHQRSCKNPQSWDYASSLHKCSTAHKYGRWYGTAWLIQKSMQQPLNIGFQYNTADQLTWVHNNPQTWDHGTAQPWHRPRISLHL